MRTLVLLLLLAPLAYAQPAPDEAGIAAAFARLVALAHAGDVGAALPLVVCPVEGEEGRPVPGRCDPTRIDHHARVEWQLARVHRLFPEEPTALRPHYTTEREGDMGFHLLLFSDLPNAPFALVSFVDVGGTPLFGEVQLDDPPTDVPPPASVMAAFERLLAAARDEATTVEAFAPLVVARGGDEERAWAAPADPAREDERRFVAEVLDGLRRMLAETAGYEVVGYDVDYEDEGAWHVLHVRFDGPEMDHDLRIAFLPVGGSFLLGDINLDA